jgi:hypothetical protein
MSMFAAMPEAETHEEEPPVGAAAAIVAKTSRLLLMAICAGPIAVFPIGLAYKSYQHFFGADTPPALIQTIDHP